MSKAAKYLPWITEVGELRRTGRVDAVNQSPNLKDLQPIEPPHKPDMSWWSEGLFLASTLPPLLPMLFKPDLFLAPLMGIVYLGVVFSLCCALLIAKPSVLKNRLKAVTLGTTLGTLLLIGWCMLN